MKRAWTGIGNGICPDTRVWLAGHGPSGLSPRRDRGSLCVPGELRTAPGGSAPSPAPDRDRGSLCVPAELRTPTRGWVGSPVPEQLCRDRESEALQVPGQEQLCRCRSSSAVPGQEGSAAPCPPRGAQEPTNSAAPWP